MGILKMMKGCVHMMRGAPSDNPDIDAKIQDLIESHPVIIFSKSYCPFCMDAKSLLKRHNAEFYTVELDQIVNGSAMQEALQRQTGQRTVPNIFIGKNHIGGFSDLKARKSDLPGMLKDAGAVVVET